MDLLKKLALTTLAVTGMTFGAAAQNAHKAKLDDNNGKAKTELPVKKTDESVIHANRVIFAHNPNKPNEIKLHYAYSRLTGKKDAKGLPESEPVLKDMYIQKEGVDVNDPAKAGSTAAIQLLYLNNQGAKFVIHNQDGTTQEVSTENDKILFEGGTDKDAVKGEVLKAFKTEKTHAVTPVSRPAATTTAPALKN